MYIRFLLCVRHRTGDTVINRADVVPDLVEDTAFLDRGLCTLSAIGQQGGTAEKKRSFGVKLDLVLNPVL